MKKLVLFFTLFCIGSLIHAQVIITEIMYNPPEAGTDSLEYLELYNHSDSPVDMTGWRFTEGLTFTFPEFILNPGEYITLCVRLSAFKAIFGDDIPVLQWTARALVNGGELLEISDSQGNVVCSVDFKSGANGWYTEADGNGASIELCNFDANPNNKESWRPSENALGVIINEKELFGTPGAPNSTECAVPADHIIEVGDFFFDPAELTIQQGEIVRWMNIGSIHNVNGTTNTYPGNPASFFSGPPQSGSWSYDFKFEIPGTYQYRCDAHPGMMTGIIIVEGDVDPELPLYAIGEVRGVNASGVADSAGIQCALIGIVHGVNIRPVGQGLQFTLIDELNDGIGIFHPSNSFGYTVNEGDLVRVEGTIEQFRGLLQMSISNLTLIEPGEGSSVVPNIVSELSEETENRLITIQNVSVVNPSQWTNTVGGFNVTVSDGTNNYEIRIARNVVTFTEAPTGMFNLTGTGGQFSGVNPPWLDGYQILPRYVADFDFISSTYENSWSESLKIYPNPVKQQLFIRSGFPIDRINVLDMTGRIQKSKDGDQTFIEMQGLQPGMYIIQIFSGNGSTVRKIVLE